LFDVRWQCKFQVTQSIF